MSFYQPGEVIRAYFPFDEPTGGKPRPVLILDIESDQLYKCCMITSTDRTGKCKGEWILKDSTLGKALGLDRNSFINLDNIKLIPRSLVEALKSPQGEYPDFDDFLQRHRIR